MIGWVILAFGLGVPAVNQIVARLELPTWAHVGLVPLLCFGGSVLIGGPWRSVVLGGTGAFGVAALGIETMLALQTHRDLERFTIMVNRKPR